MCSLMRLMIVCILVLINTLERWEGKDTYGSKMCSAVRHRWFLYHFAEYPDIRHDGVMTSHDLDTLQTLLYIISLARIINS